MDNLEQAVSAAYDSVNKASSESPGSSPPTAGDAAPPSEGAPAAGNAGKEPAGGERARDESGKFVAAKPVEQPEQAAPVAAPTQAHPQAPAAAKGPPPVNWKGAGKVVWDKLPAAVQKEITDDYTRIAKSDGELQQWGSVITPDRAQAFAAQFGSVHEGVKRLLAYSDFASKQPREFLRQFAQANRIDLTSLTGQPAATGEQPSPPQGQHPLEREVIELRNAVQQMKQGDQSKQLEAVTTEISRFRNDPAHPYFNDVENEMRVLLPHIQGTYGERLQKAYDQAVWANPQTREALITAERDKALQANAATVTEAKKAAGLNGSPAGAKVPNDEPRLSLEETVRRAADRVLQ